MWLLVILPLLSALVANMVLLAYMFWPKRYEAIPFDRFVTDRARLTVAVHGSGDTSETWAYPFLQAVERRYPDSAVMSVDWDRYADNPLRCAIDGARIGRLSGAQFADNASLSAIHLVSHSCGAFVIYNACREIKARRPELRVQTTYLDPVSIYGPWLRYGVSHFGDCADYSEAYIDTGDQVAGSNELLPNTHTYDVTAIRERRALTINPHVWPTRYYLELTRQGGAPALWDGEDLQRLRPRGQLQVVE